MAIYETHCHLNHPQFESDLDQVLQRAEASGIGRLLVVGYDMASSRRAISMANTHPNVVASIGIHPEDCSDWTDDNRDELISLANSGSSKSAAWGEIGLDFHWKTHDPEVQKKVFVQQLEIAKELNLPVIIHCRDAYDETIDILEACGTTRAVLHCFTGSVVQAQRAVSLGFSLGVGGVITYKNASDVREAAAAVPLDRILLETDSPFLAPQPWRGKRNEPSYITAVTAKLAELHGLSPDKIAEATWENAASFFN